MSTNRDTEAQRRAKLVARFEAQARFTQHSSPLYHQLFSALGRRLAEDTGFAAWLLTASAGRAPFDVPLLLLAALHQSVLRRSPETRELAAWYPSMGGTKELSEPGLSQALAQSVDALRPELASFIASRPVQTNEAGRGLCWLLPASYTGWPKMHLVELGASAGLNLMADECRYALVVADTSSGASCVFGRGREVDFAVQGEGAFAPPDPAAIPQIVSRNGCDLAPIQLDSEAERLYLAAFVWADQPRRMRVLNEAIATSIRIKTSAAPVHLAPCRLPEDLPGFLQDLPKLEVPCILYNTYLRAYLQDKGDALQEHISQWALRQAQPVLWLQWEHLRSDPAPPAFGWLGWTAQLWHQGQDRSWHLAWVHPHGSRIVWLPDIFTWRAYWQQIR